MSEQQRSSEDAELGFVPRDGREQASLDGFQAPDRADGKRNGAMAVDDEEDDDFMAAEPAADVFQRFVLKPDRASAGAGSVPASGSRGRLAKALQATSSKAKASSDSAGSADRAAKRASGRAEESSEDDEALAQPPARPARKAAKRGKAKPDVRRSGRERTAVDYRDQVPAGVAVLHSDSDEMSAASSDEGGAEGGSFTSASDAAAAVASGDDDDEVCLAAPSRAARAAGRRAPPGAAVLDSDDEATRDDGGDAEGADDSDVECVAERGPPPRGEHTVDEIDKIMADKTENGKRSYLVKFKGMSYRQLEWRAHSDMFAAKRSLVHAYQRKLERGTAPMHVNGTPDGVAPEWRMVERVFESRTKHGRLQYYVKWGVLGYAESTWEDAAALTSDADRAAVERFERHKLVPPRQEEVGPEQLIALLQGGQGVPEFANGRVLRDYQVESFKWMVQNNLKGQSCILGDEMGLGKTAQSISVMEFRRTKAKVRGPFLVVAPLTTLGHWRREIETWTDMNVVCFSGGKDDRQVIQEHELYFPAAPGSARGAGRRLGTPKFNVLLTNSEMLRDCPSVFGRFRWDVTIVDEAHKLKGLNSEIRRSVEALYTKWLLLLTGTPIQNNMQELYSIMNLVSSRRFHDLPGFLRDYGDPPRTPSTPEQLQALQEELRPLLLRRMKEDVETLPDKEEIIIWVELTKYQRAYYKALYEQQIASLLKVSNKELPNLRNLAMELRKVCCHPFLCNGLEDDLRMRLTTLNKRAPGDVELLEAASGKLALLGKLLPKLRAEGRKVLVFSQFKIMLNVVSDYLDLLRFPFERIDGDTNGPERQAAMDRFQAGGDATFAFLLSTKAGGQGITLTAADTIVLYDSDWNPQNDIQAMARAHRIGQTSNVTIYRLVTHGTYEEVLISTANQKSGLNEAILGNINVAGNPEDNAARITRLLREGANSITTDDAEAEAQASRFEGQDIDSILQSRTSRRNIANKSGSSFSVATFRAEGGGGGGGEGGADAGAAFWQDLLPEAVKAHEKAERERNLVHGPRARRRVNYREAHATGADTEYKADASPDGSGDDDDDYAVELAREEREERRQTIDAAMTATAAAATAAAAGVNATTVATGDPRLDGVHAARAALHKAVVDVDTMLLRWGPEQVADAIKAVDAADDDADILSQVPRRHWNAAACAQTIATSLEQPARNVAALIAEWRAVLQARAPGFPMKRPNTNHALTAAGKAAEAKLAAGGELSVEEREAAVAAVAAAAEETRRIDAKFAASIHAAVSDILAGHACKYVQALWPGPADVDTLQRHIYYRALRASSKRLNQYASRDALYAATASHKDPSDLLVQILAQGWPLPQAEEGSALHFLAQHGLWKAGATVDGRVIECGLHHGIDCTSTQVSKADAAPFPQDVLSAEAYDPEMACLADNAPAGNVLRSRVKPAWAAYKSTAKAAIYMSSALHAAVALELARRFVDLMRLVATNAKLPKHQGSRPSAGSAVPASAGGDARATPAGGAAAAAAAAAQTPAGASGAGPSSSGAGGARPLVTPAAAAAPGGARAALADALAAEAARRAPPKPHLPLKPLANSKAVNSSSTSGGSRSALQSALPFKPKGAASGGKGAAAAASTAGSKENSQPGDGGAQAAAAPSRAPLGEAGGVVDLCAAEDVDMAVAGAPGWDEDDAMSSSDGEERAGGEAALVCERPCCGSVQAAEVGGGDAAQEEEALLRM